MATIVRLGLAVRWWSGEIVERTPEYRSGLDREQYTRPELVELDVAATLGGPLIDYRESESFATANEPITGAKS